jgi:O-antigen/teichoic acid export membrane protein
MDAEKVVSLTRSLIPKFFLMFLRGTSLVSKFLLLVVMGRYLTLADIGIYGLVLGAAVLYTQAAGWGFGFHLNRHMVTAGVEEKRMLFAHQWGVFFYTYLATILLSVPFFFPGALQFSHMDVAATALALFIVIGEHAANELTRLLITTKRALKGNLLLFLNTAGWSFPVVCLLFLVPSTRSLDVILGAWCFFKVIVLILGMWWCREYIENPRFFLRDSLFVPRTWVLEHIAPSLTVYVAFLANVVLLYVNRFTVGAFLGIDEAGLFTIYWSVVYAFYMLAKTGFIQTSSPAMIEVHKDKDAYRLKVGSLYKQTGIFAVVSGICLAVLAPWLFALMHKTKAVENLPFFYALLVCGIVRLIAMVSFYALYARHDDKILMKGMLATVALGVPVSVVSIMTMGLWGAVLSEGFFALAMLLILVREYRKKVSA